MVSRVGTSTVRGFAFFRLRGVSSFAHGGRAVQRGVVLDIATGKRVRCENGARSAPGSNRSGGLTQCSGDSCVRIVFRFHVHLRTPPVDHVLDWEQYLGPFRIDIGGPSLTSRSGSRSHDTDDTRHHDVPDKNFAH